MWDALGPVLVGSGATLVATTFVQLWVVPRVETRKRRDDRWERDVRDLGELLAFDYPKARGGIQHVLAIHAIATEAVAGGGVDPASVSAFMEKERESLAEQAETFTQVCERIDWLAEQVLRRDYSGKALDPLRSARMGLFIARARANMVRPRSWEVGDASVSHDQVTEIMDRLQDAHKALVKAVSDLSMNPPPPAPNRFLGKIAGAPSALRARRRLSPPPPDEVEGG